MGVLWFILVAILGFLSFSPLEVNCVLGADPQSLMKITGALCGSQHDEQFAQGFYNCYNLLDEKEKCIFDNCQKTVFNGVLNTMANIEYSCKVPQKLPVYVNCLMTQFKACNRNVVKAVTTINICQGNLLGVE